MLSRGLVLSTLSALLLLTACSGSSTSDSDGSSAAAVSSDKADKVKSSAKDAIQSVLKLDEKKKFDKVKFKNADGKGCFQVIAPLLPFKGSPLVGLNLNIRAVGGDAVAARGAAEKLCDTAVILNTDFKSSCNLDPSSVEVHVYDKDACDRDHTYVGLIGDDDKAEAAIGKHHHYDEVKDGELVLGPEDAFDDGE